MAEDLSRYSVAELEPLYWTLARAGDTAGAEPYRVELASRTWQNVNPYAAPSGVASRRPRG
jgi:hypothetical protein